MTCYQGRLPLKIYVRRVFLCASVVTEQEYIDYAQESRPLCFGFNTIRFGGRIWRAGV